MTDSYEGIASLLKKAAKGKAILFCGAGASIDSINANSTELPTINPLLEMINLKIGTAFTRIDIAASKLASSSRSEYFRLITDTYRVTSVSKDMDTIISYPWHRVYTTNYDSSIEKSCDNLRKKYHVYTQNDSPLSILPQDLPIVHLHGYVVNFNYDNIRTDCILDYNSNIANKVYDGPWSVEFKNDISTADIVVFLGYSLYDPEIAKIILKGDISKKKIYFINSAIHNEELQYMQEQYGNPLWLEKEGFARIINSVLAEVSTDQRRSLVCFTDSRDLSVADKNVNYQDLIDLFLFGRVNDVLLQSDLIKKARRYVIRPSIVDKIKSKVESGSGFISIYSPLGHGKSVIAKILTQELSQDRDVFVANRNQPEFMDEIKYIISNYSRPIIVIDDFYKFSSHFSNLSAFDESDVTFIITSRLNVYESRKDELDSTFHNFEISNFRIGELTRSDATALVPLIDQAGLWGKTSSSADHTKAQILLQKNRDGFQGNFADILIGLMKSQELIGRIRKELSILKELSLASYRCVLLSLYLEFTNNHIDEFIINLCLDVNFEIVNSSADVGNIFRLFFNAEDSGEYFRGSIFAKYAIQNICNSDDLLDTIQIAVDNLSSAKSTSRESKTVLVDLLRFNYLKVVADEKKERLEKIRDLYSNLAANPKLNRDDLFWNAFGMCERQLSNYGEAIKHIRTGISYAAGRRNYTPYHAQNQLIACLLERGIAEDVPLDEVFNNALEVSDLLVIQADDERLFGSGQAFQWHQMLSEFLDAYGPRFSDTQRIKVVMQFMKYSKFIKENVVDWRNRSAAAMMIAKVDSFLRRTPIAR